jgi:predicted GTPase
MFRLIKQYILSKLLKIYSIFIKNKKGKDNSMEILISFIKKVSQTQSKEHPYKIRKRIEKYENIIKELNNISIQIGSSIDNIDSLNKDFYYWKEKQFKPWLQDKCVIAFIGRFSSGKSSIINTILGNDILPVMVTPTTAIPTYISFNIQDDCLIVDKDDNIKKISFDDLHILSKDNLQDFPISMIFRYVVVAYGNDKLKNKTLLDTPGYDSTDEIDKDSTAKVINDSDAVFWVIDVNDGTISADSLNFIKDTIQNKPLYVIINKVDTKCPKDNIRVKENVETTLIEKDIKLEKCILYSAKSVKKGESKYINELTDILSKIEYKVKDRDIDNIIINNIERNIMLVSKKIQTELEKQKELKRNGLNNNINNYVYNFIDNSIDKLQKYKEDLMNLKNKILEDNK